jgi:hypothetical protein
MAGRELTEDNLPDSGALVEAAGKHAVLSL